MTMRVYVGLLCLVLIVALCRPVVGDHEEGVAPRTLPSPEPPKAIITLPEFTEPIRIITIPRMKRGMDSTNLRKAKKGLGLSRIWQDLSKKRSPFRFPAK